MIITNATRDELILLGKKLLSAESEEESDRLYQQFNAHFSHPDTANLFYWPEGRDNQDVSGYEPSVDEVVDAGINHRPIAL